MKELSLPPCCLRPLLGIASLESHHSLFAHNFNLLVSIGEARHEACAKAWDTLLYQKSGIRRPLMSRMYSQQRAGLASKSLIWPGYRSHPYRMSSSTFPPLPRRVLALALVRTHIINRCSDLSNSQHSISSDSHRLGVQIRAP